MSMKQDIMTAFLTALGNISTDNGYSINIGSHVYEWPDSDIPKSVTHAIAIRDPRDEIVDGDEQAHRVEYEIIYRNVGSTAPAQIRAVQEDILTAVATVIGLESDISAIDYESSETEVVKEQKRMAFVAMYFSVYFTDNEWNI